MNSSLNYSAPTAPFDLPPEIHELKLLARDVVTRECIPLEAQYLRGDASQVSAHQFGQSEGSLPAESWERLHQLSVDTGLFTAHLPEEYGGSGIGILGNFVVEEELNRSLVQLPRMHVPNVLFASSEDQKRRYLYPVLEGTKRWAFAQTEPGAGSDPGNSMATRAIRSGDEWVISGTKTFISEADRSDFMVLLAVTDEDKRQRGGITMFLVDSHSPGVSMTPVPIWTTPHRPFQFTVHLDEVRVPHENIVGDVGGGFAIGQTFLIIQDRLTRGSLATGILSRSLEIATEWAKNRQTFGQPLSNRQAIQWMLADVFMDLQCIRSVSYRCAARADGGIDVRVDAAVAKYLGANWGHRSIDMIMQILGGIGESTEMPIVHWYHQLRHGRIGGGTDEMQKMLIARAILDKGSDLWLA